MAESSAEWYRKPGHITLFCRDLSWLNTEMGMEILKARACGDGLTLYLKELDDDITNVLRKAGAIIYQISESPSTKHRFSTRESNDTMELIIRSKDRETSGLVFVETNDPINDPSLLSLMNDMLLSLR